MRLLLVTHERGMRGGEVQLALVAGALAARGHAVTVAAPADAELFARSSASVAARRFAAVNDLDAAAAVRLARIVREVRPEVVHAFTGRAHAIARMALLGRGPPLVVSRLAGFAPGKGPLARWKFAGVAAYAAVSREAKEALLAAGVPEARVEVVPSAVADEFLGREGQASRNGNVVGCVAALSPEKGHETLVAACARVAGREPVELRLVGDGPERARVEARARSLGFTGLRFLGPLSGVAVAEALAGFTVFALASEVEGLPTSVLEAMAMGVPVVATAVGGVPGIVEDGVTGRLVPPGDAGALARAIEQLLASPEERERLAAAARKVARAHSVARVVAAYEELYRKVARTV